MQYLVGTVSVNKNQRNWSMKENHASQAQTPTFLTLGILERFKARSRLLKERAWIRYLTTLFTISSKIVIWDYLLIASIHLINVREIFSKLPTSVLLGKLNEGLFIMSGMHLAHKMRPSFFRLSCQQDKLEGFNLTQYLKDCKPQILVLC